MEISVGSSKLSLEAKTISEVLSSLGLSREEALVKVNGSVRPEDWKLSPSDSVEVIKVVFGG